MDAAVEVAVARQHGGRIQIAVNDFLLDHRIQCAAHAIAGGAGERDDSETQLLQFRQQTGFFQVQLHCLGTRRQRGLHPRFADQAACVRIAREQSGGDHVAWIGRIGAAGDGRDDHRAIGHQALGFFCLARFEFGFVGNAALGQIRHRQTLVWIAGAGHVADHAGQIELQHALVLRGGQRIGPQTGGARVVFDQRQL
ncbi:hypothetical protein D3C81_913910 [compost metagenome]